MGSPATDLTLEDLQRLIRQAVSYRDGNLPEGTILYLSLYGEEIDQRFQRFRDACPELSLSSDLSRFSAAGSHLELTDVVVCHGSGKRTIVLRGGSSNFPLFW